MGSWTPARTSWTPRTSLVKYRVISSRFFSEPSAYSEGLMKFAAAGEKTTPASREMTGAVSNNFTEI